MSARRRYTPLELAFRLALLAGLVAVLCGYDQGCCMDCEEDYGTPHCEDRTECYCWHYYYWPQYAEAYLRARVHVVEEGRSIWDSKIADLEVLEVFNPQDIPVDIPETIEQVTLGWEYETGDIALVWMVRHLNLFLHSMRETDGRIPCDRDEAFAGLTSAELASALMSDDCAAAVIALGVDAEPLCD